MTSPSSHSPACATGHALLSLAGRLLIASLFLPAGISKLTGFSGTVGYIQSVGLPLPQAAAAVAVVIEIAGSLMLILGFKTRWAALAMAVFTLMASYYFHAYWSVPEAARMVQSLFFKKNMAIAGGLLALAGLGAGAWSLDAWRARAA